MPQRPVPLDAIDAALTGGAVAIGNFDGLHRGHQSVLSAALGWGRPAVILTFEPHPRMFFSGAPLFRLTPPPMKARVADAFGMDATVVAPFDADLAALPADAFVADIIAGRLNARHVAVGANFKFGAQRSGSAETLRDAGAAHGFSVSVAEPLADGEVISSTAIRRHLEAGNVEGASRLLGWRYQIVSQVVHGEKRGRHLGYPTANQSLGADNALRHGVYAVRAHIDGAWRDGVASFGRRPQFDFGRPLLETFVFDFSGDLYGRTMPVTFVAFLRPEMRFDSVAGLIEQMDKDSLNARAALASLAPLTPLDKALNFERPGVTA